MGVGMNPYGYQGIKTAGWTSPVEYQEYRLTKLINNVQNLLNRNLGLSQLDVNDWVSLNRYVDDPLKLHLFDVLQKLQLALVTLRLTK